ncbi:MAG: alpha/beta hydrolase [Chloroflexi bacterium]|nr:alpha/beta hydrolase [Chloroflexota bacterium]
MASAELQKVLDLMAQRPLGGGATDIQGMRAGMEETAFPATEAATVTPVEANGVPGEWVTVAESDPSRRLLYVHGGGYVIGSPVTHRRLCEDIARAGGCAVLNLDYRLAPEAPFPAAVEDAIEGLKFIQENGPSGAGAAESVFVAGDSAGGGLTLATLLAARDRGVEQPNAAIGISSWTDLAITGETIQTRAEADPLITDASMINGMATAYLGSTEATDPLASPLYADYAGLPPLLLQVGDAEVLLADTTRVAEKARAAGVDVVEEVWDEMFHVWHAFAPMLPEGQAAIDRIGEFICQHA